MSLDLISMDFQSIVVGVIACFIVSFLFYIIYTFGIREKSFEEVLEEQKKRSIQEEMQQKMEKGKKEKKFNKKWSKKGKEKTDQVHDSPKPAIKAPDTKEFSVDIEIVEPKEIKPKHKNKSKTANVTVNVPDNTNILEKVKKAEIAIIPEKPTQEKKKEKTETIKEKDKLKVENKEGEVRKSKATEEEEKLSHETTIPAPVSSSSETSNTIKKKKKDHADKVDVAKLSASKLLSLIKDAELDTEESQTLIDILLNKQKDSAEWTKPKDMLATTKKSLQEKEQLFEQEHRQHQATMSKLKELRDEYNQIKTKLSAQERNNQEKVTRYQQEIQALTLRIKQMSEQLVTEKEKVIQIEKATEEKIERYLKRFKDENTKLQQTVLELEARSLTGASQTEIEALQKSHDDLQKVHSLLVDQHTQLVASQKTNTNTNVQLSDLKEQLEDVNEKHATLLKEVKTLKDSKAALEMSKHILEEKLKGEEQFCQKNKFQAQMEDVQKQSVELEAQMKQMDFQISEMTQQNGQLQSDLLALQAENDSLSEQLISTKERVAGDGQEIVHQNGELNGKVQEEIHLKSINEKDKLLKEKETMLTQLNEDLNKQKAKIAVLSEEVETQKQKNNDLREKNWKAMDALTNAEKTNEEKLKVVQISANEKLVQVQKEFEGKLRQANDSLQSSKPSEELIEKLKDFENRFTKLSIEYNCEEEKNRHLTSEVERISELQKSSEFRVSEILKNVENLRLQLEETQYNTKECLQRIFPEMSVDNSLLHDSWLAQFEKQAVLAVQVAASRDNSELQGRLSHYAEKEKESVSKLQHYEKVLSDTEATLQRLQESAESQEAQWFERFSQKEHELQKILEERDAFSAEKEAFQLTFQQLEEKKEKLKLFESTLEAAENERSHLEQKYDEVNKNCINLRDQLENKEKTILELQKEKGSIANLKQELEEVKTKLEKEKKISKDFSSQMIRLNSLVKIGQDSLSFEQETVRNLKSQLEATQKATANGTSSTILSPAVTTNEDVSVKK